MTLALMTPTESECYGTVMGPLGMVICILSLQIAFSHDNLIARMHAIRNEDLQGSVMKSFSGT